VRIKFATDSAEPRAVPQATFLHQKGAVISVRGADEAWLFVDGQLVLDHGGPGYKSSTVRALLQDLQRHISPGIPHSETKSPMPGVTPIHLRSGGQL